MTTQSKDYLKKNAENIAYEDPAVFEKAPEQHTELHRLWNAFKCRSYTEFFAEYRRAMEQYMKEKGIKEPFRFMIYSSYHRSFPGFSHYEDYRKSHSYLMTLEDPQTFIGVFDFVGPMGLPTHIDPDVKRACVVGGVAKKYRGREFSGTITF